MDLALSHLDENTNEPFLIIAEEQSHGRGRGNSEFYSPIGGFYGTYLIKIEKKLDSRLMRFLHYLTALSIQQALRESYNLECKIKWPNDIYVKNRKLGGILLEIISKKGMYLLIGIGLNINSTKEQFSHSLNSKITSLTEELNHFIVVENLIKYITINLFNFIKRAFSGLTSDMILEYNSILLNIDKIHEYKSKSYKCKGINKDGLLILYSEENEIEINIEESREINLIY